jgi:hypothetical protein
MSTGMDGLIRASHRSLPVELGRAHSRAGSMYQNLRGQEYQHWTCVDPFWA